MKRYLVVCQLARVVAVIVVALVVALALIHSRRSGETLAVTPLARGKADVPVGGFARCRSLAPDDTELFEPCGRSRAGNRQRVFASSKCSQQTIAVASNAPTFSVDKVDYVPLNGAEHAGGR